MSIPSVLARTRDLLRSFPAPWALCGGWAVDSWLERATREHGDVDLTLWHHDQLVVLDHLRDGWLLNGHDEDDEAGTAPWTGRSLAFPAHIHAYSEAGDNLDIQLNRVRDGAWVFSSRAGVTLPIGQCFATSPWGLPTVTPPVVLFYKAIGSIRTHDEADFAVLAPLLSSEERSWLLDALDRLRPGHPWSPQLLGGTDGNGTTEPLWHRRPRPPLPERPGAVPERDAATGITHDELVAALRATEGLQDVGNTNPNLHFRSRPFLHFHDGADGIYADVRFGTGDFEPVRASTPRERADLLARVRRHVAKVSRTRKGDRKHERRRR